MKETLIRINNLNKMLVYNPYLHKFYIEDTGLQQRVDSRDTAVLDTTMLEEQYKKMEYDLLAKSISSTFIVITNNCNMSCDFCSALKNTDSNFPSVKIEDIKLLKSKMPETNNSFVIISGGEPLLYFDLVRQIQKEYKWCRVYTNGSFIDEDIVKWGIETDTKFAISLDYKIDGLSGHDSLETRHNLNNLLIKYPEFKNNFNIVQVLTKDSVKKYSRARQEYRVGFERDILHEMKFIRGSGEIKTCDIDDEIDLIESGEITLNESIFYREMRYFSQAINDKFNLKLCAPAVNLSHRGEIFYCTASASRAHVEKEQMCTYHGSIADFDMIDYQKKYIGVKNKGVCFRDCVSKWFCGGVCIPFHSKDRNDMRCGATPKLLPYVFYLAANYSNIPLEEFPSLFN